MRKRLFCICLAVLMVLGAVAPLGVAAPAPPLATNFEVTRSPIAAGYDIMAIRTDGSVWISSYNNGNWNEERIIIPFNAVEVASAGGGLGVEAFYVLNRFGDLYWTQFWSGLQLEEPARVASNVISTTSIDEQNNLRSGDELVMSRVADVTGTFGTFILRTDGSVWFRDFDSENNRVTREILTGIVQIDCHGHILIARDVRGRVWKYDSSTSALSVVTDNVTDISVGSFGLLTRKADGTLWHREWASRLGGAFTDGVQLDVGTDIVYFTCATGFEWANDYAIFLRADGSVWRLDMEREWNEDFTISTTVGYTTTRVTSGVAMPTTRPGGVAGNPPVLPEDIPLPFTDVADTNWFYPYVRHVADNNIMQGTTATTFDPTANFSRAQVVATLYRITHGGPAREFPYEDNRVVFDDVAEDSWFAHYAAWAYDNDIVQGIGNNRFGGNRNVTREQFATMLHRFATFREHDDTVTTGEQWEDFTDRDQISPWAQDELTWANYHGLITGRTTTTIVPGGTAQRAEAAAILMRFMQAFGE